MNTDDEAKKLKDASPALKNVPLETIKNRLNEIHYAPGIMGGSQVNLNFYDPNQPRDPKGSETGGQWTDGGDDSTKKEWTKKPVGGKTWQELAMPEKSSGDFLQEIDGELTPITEGSENQIKYANDLRNDFVAHISHRETMAQVRSARLHMEHGEDMKDFDISVLAQDAFDRNTLRIVNSSNSKTIIDRLKPDLQSQMKYSDLLGKYKDIIRYPSIYQYDEKKGWIRISYDVKLRNTRSPENNPQWKFKP